MKFASPDDDMIFIFGFVVFFDIILETLLFHLQWIFERRYLKEDFWIVWSINQLRNWLLQREMNFQMNLRHSHCHRSVAIITLLVITAETIFLVMFYLASGLYYIFLRCFFHHNLKFWKELSSVVFCRRILTYESSRTLPSWQIVFNIARPFSAFSSLLSWSTAVSIFFCQPNKSSFNGINRCKKNPIPGRY